MIVGRKAAQCALEINLESQRFNYGDGREVAIGVGFGECGIMHAGGVFGRVEYFLIGKGLSAALKSLRYSTSEAPLVVSPSLSRLVDKFFVWKPLPSNIHLPEKTFDFVFGMPVRSSFNTLQLR